MAVHDSAQLSNAVLGSPQLGNASETARNLPLSLPLSCLAGSSRFDGRHCPRSCDPTNMWGWSLVGLLG